MNFFEPMDPKEHELCKQGVDLPDYCRNCGRAFFDHSNGVCPKEEDDVKEEEVA